MIYTNGPTATSTAIYLLLIISQRLLIVSAAPGGLRDQSRALQTVSASNTATNTTIQRSYRIIGGQDVPEGKYPFMAVLELGCGASLIAPDMLLSVAHCYEFAQRSDYAFIGSSLLNQGIPRRIIDIIRHPDYDEVAGSYDYMLITLDQPVEGIEPVKLNGDMSTPRMITLQKDITDPSTINKGAADNLNKNNQVGELLTVIGFGVTKEGASQMSETLQEVNVAYVPYQTCKSWYKHEYVDEATMFCAGFERGGKDSCQGDSGSPIIDSNGVQLGTVSWGEGCARPMSPGVYARVSTVRPWIYEQICARSTLPSSDICTGSLIQSSNEGDSGKGGDSTQSNTGGYVSSAMEQSGSTATRHTIQIDMKLDANPQQVSYIFVNTDRGEVIDSKMYGSMVTPYEEKNLVYQALPSGHYTFLVTDIAGNGICCVSGAGYIIISEMNDDGSSSLIWANNGSFGGSSYKLFELKN